MLSSAYPYRVALYRYTIQLDIWGYNSEMYLHKSYTCAVDWWSFGVTIYEMAIGVHPFLQQETWSALNRLPLAVVKEEPVYPNWLEYWTKDFIIKLSI
ncbi:protein kinase C theta type isoform X1 [Bombina bombina]|uniref:protein kinase C theta type isoform X1 n=1 Tax=Bombina bombina TaxID=8345 RepID=UPI00235B255D|nr:protein kinase C theta type isoform X1 [Bombina bombina]